MKNRSPFTKEIVLMALMGQSAGQIIQKLKTVPPTTIYDIIRKYTKEVRILIRELPEDQEELDL
jgi:hypothetical protein